MRNGLYSITWIRGRFAQLCLALVWRIFTCTTHLILRGLILGAIGPIYNGTGRVGSHMRASIARSMLQAHNGVITLPSDLSQGTVVVGVLPIAKS